jgi:hypothetical protein
LLPGIHNRTSQEQAERVVLATPLASCDDFKAKNSLFKPSAALGLKIPISSPLGMMDAAT